MAKKTQKKPSRNVLVLAETVSKGRGKNKRTEVKAKKGKLGTRLFCLPTRPIKKGESRKNAAFECFGSWEDAQVALLARRAAASPAAAANPALKAMLEMQEGVKGLRGALPARGRRRGLRGPVYQDGHFEGETFTDGVDWYASVGRAGQHRPMPGRFSSEAAARAALLRHVGEAPARGLRGTPEEHLDRAQAILAAVRKHPGLSSRDKQRWQDIARENADWGFDLVGSSADQIDAEIARQELYSR